MFIPSHKEEACAATYLARRNSQHIKRGMVCGCYYCMKVYDGGEVVTFIDDGKTAVCPYCGVDAVLPNQGDVSALRAVSEYWFSYNNTNSE